MIYKEYLVIIDCVFINLLEEFYFLLIFWEFLRMSEISDEEKMFFEILGEVEDDKFVVSIRNIDFVLVVVVYMKMWVIVDVW